MARSFASASSQYLTRSDTSITSYPITMAAWGYPAQTNQNCVAVSLGNNGALGQLQVRFNSSGVAESIRQDDAGNNVLLSTANSYSANTWAHVCAIFNSAAQSTYLNADTVNKGSDTTSITAPSVDFITIGALRRAAVSGQFNGRIAHAAIWTAALTEAEVVDLYNNGVGADPRNIRPDALVAYWPLLNNDGDADWWGQYNLTASGSPTYAAHPPVLMKSRPRFVVIGSASSAPSGSGTPSTGAATASGSGQLTNKGSGTPSTAAATASGSGQLKHSGSGAVQFPVAFSSMASGTGLVSGQAAGSGTPSTAAATASGAGNLTYKATGTPSVAVASASGSGKLTLKGSGTPSTAAATASGTGSVGGAPAGTGSPSTAAATASGTGKLTLKGSGSATTGAATASGVARMVYLAVGAATAGGATASGAGSILPSGSGAVTLASATATGTGSLAGAIIPDVDQYWPVRSAVNSRADMRSATNARADVRGDL